MSIETPPKPSLNPEQNTAAPDVQVPNDASSLVEKRNGLGKKAKVGIAGGVLALLAAGGVGFGLATNQAPEKEEPVATAPANPGETTEPSAETPWSPEVTVEQLEITSGLETEALGQELISRLDDWRNAGTDNQKVYQDWRAFNGETGDYVLSISGQYAPIYTESLFVDDWQTKEDLVRTQQYYVDLNSHTLELNLITSNPENGDTEAFHRNITYDGAREISNDGTTRVIEVDYTESNNADQNRVGEEFNTEEEGNFGTPQATYVFTLTNIDGFDKISSVSIKAGY